jgi:ATPase subunit of ABC transporter with duplicated ATPase domains
MERQIERYKIWGAMRDSETMERAAKVLERKLAKVERLDLPRIDNPKTRLDTSSRRRSGNEVLQIEDLRYAPGNKPLLGAIRLKLFYQDRACLLGANGSGKTTLLRLVLGELKPEQGQIRLGVSLTIGYLPQVIRFAEEERTVLDYFCRRHDIGQGEARTLLARALFGRDEVFKQLSSLSGGERSRLLLLSLCLDRPNFLIMDEPTNHLDIDSRENLEELLQGYDGTLLFVSHDRTFIRKIADRILVLEAGQLTDHAMDYDTYRQYSQTSAPTEPALPAKERPARPSPRAVPVSLTEPQGGAKIAIDQLETDIANLEAELCRIEAAMQKEAFHAEPLLALHQEMEACTQNATA